MRFFRIGKNPYGLSEDAIYIYVPEESSYLPGLYFTFLDKGKWEVVKSYCLLYNIEELISRSSNNGDTKEISLSEFVLMPEADDIFALLGQMI